MIYMSANWLVSCRCASLGSQMCLSQVSCFDWEVYTTTCHQSRDGGSGGVKRTGWQWCDGGFVAEWTQKSFCLLFKSHTVSKGWNAWRLFWHSFSSLRCVLFPQTSGTWTATRPLRRGRSRELNMALKVQPDLIRGLWPLRAQILCTTGIIVFLI